VGRLPGVLWKEGRQPRAGDLSEGPREKKQGQRRPERRQGHFGMVGKCPELGFRKKKLGGVYVHNREQEWKKKKGAGVKRELGATKVRFREKRVCRACWG